MGCSYSQEQCMSTSLTLLEESFYQPCLLPDIGIDESLVKYSGLDSNSVLQTYSNGLVNTVPGYVDRLGSSLSSLNSVPNSVGLGALVLSMIMEICIKSASQTNDNSYSIFQRVFGEEKVSAVRNTVSKYMKRHEMFINNEQRLLGELQRLEQQLSDNLVTLRLWHLDCLLKKFKTYKSSITEIHEEDGVVYRDHGVSSLNRYPFSGLEGLNIIFLKTLNQAVVII